jgi:hypothetical protein
MKKILKLIFSSSITLTLWFYFDNVTDKIRSILFPKKTILKEIYKETLEIEEPKIEVIKEVKKDYTWLDSFDYIFWGDQNFRERLKTEGIWKTLWEPYVKSDNSTTTPTNTQPLSAHDAVVKTDDIIKDSATSSANHIYDVLTTYFSKNMTWIDYLIIQGFKIIAILAIFLLVYWLLSLLIKLVKKN